MAKPKAEEKKLEEFWINSKRIFTIATKPTRKEFMSITKICVIGMAIVGGLSFIIQLITTVVDFTGA